MNDEMIISSEEHEMDVDMMDDDELDMPEEITNEDSYEDEDSDDDDDNEYEKFSGGEDDEDEE